MNKENRLTEVVKSFFLIKFIRLKLHHVSVLISLVEFYPQLPYRYTLKPIELLSSGTRPSSVNILLFFLVAAKSVQVRIFLRPVLYSVRILYQFVDHLYKTTKTFLKRKPLKIWPRKHLLLLPSDSRHV